MMSFLENKKNKKIFILTISTVLTIAILVAAFAIYVNDYYHADMDVIESFRIEGDITYTILNDNTIVFEPDNATKGFIFYPGGKVEYTAYIPLMQSCAEQDILCVLIEMPFNLAVFDINAADGIQEKYPQIEEWYIGGHSLGGSMAASYLFKHINDYKGLILCGSYSTENFSNTKLKVLSIYGSEDGVLNREKYIESNSNMPNDFTEIVISGGCHAYFGMYGMQEDDGTPTITALEQIVLTASFINDFLMNDRRFE